MIKPKTQSYRVKVMLIKLEAVTNRVATRCYASLKIDGEEQPFKANPELKKNVALFNSEVEFDNFNIQVDEVTGLYENKPALLQLDIETQGTKMRMGEVTINLGGILNEKKYRIVNQYPLAKCYDKTAKVRMSVDFIPLGGPETSFLEKKERKEVKSREHLISNESDTPFVPTMGERRPPNLKSRLAEESNVILQEKIYEYEQKMDNYRLSQTQLQEKLHEQINNKDEQITELTIETNRKAQQLSAVTLENQQLRFKLKEQADEINSLKEQKKSLVLMVEGLQKSQQALRKEISSLKASLQNQSRTKQNKQKYYNQELAKYTARYLQSQQQRNKIIFELQTKFKQQLEKKQTNYKNIITNNQKKYEEHQQQLKNNIAQLQQHLNTAEEGLIQFNQEIKKGKEALQIKEKEEHQLKQNIKQLVIELDKIKQNNIEVNSELETLNFSYNEVEHDLQRTKEELQTQKRVNQQLKMEIVMANQTIEEQYKTITKNNRELQTHHQRQYYLTQKYNDELEVKSINEDNIRSESYYLKEEIHKLRGQLAIAEERADEQSNKNNELLQNTHKTEIELVNRSQLIMRLGEEKMTVENQLKIIRNELADMEEAVLMLKEENLQLTELLQEKKEALDNDKSLEWSYRIEQLQNDISEMVEKFKVEKEALKDNYRREDSKKKEQINQMALLMRKIKDQAEQTRKFSQKRELALKELQRTTDHLKIQLNQKSKDYDQLKQKLKSSQHQQEALESKQKATQNIWENKVKELQNKLNKETSSAKKVELNKIALEKICHLLIEYLARPYQTVVGFQEIMVPDAEGEFLNLVNLSIKKHCEDRTKVREQLKKIESLSWPERQESKKSDLQPYRSKEKILDISEKQIKTYQSTFQPWRPKPSNYQLQQARDQNTKLKRQISQLKIKIRSIEQQVSKAQRNTDLQRQQKNELKHELQQLQDEIDKNNFQLKRKDKLINQLQNQLKETQNQIVNLRTSTVNNNNAKVTTTTQSRAEYRGREKEQNVLNNRREIVIRDLETRLENKNKEQEETAVELSRLKGQNSALKQGIIQLNNQLKLMESKYKDRCSKASTQEAQLLQLKNKLEDDLHRETLSHKQQIELLGEQLMKTQDENIYHQKEAEQLRSELDQFQRKLKMTRDQFKQLQLKTKKQYEQAINKLKESNHELENQIANLQSELQQLQLKRNQENIRNSNQNALISKRTEEIDRLNGLLRNKEQNIFELEQQIQSIQQQNYRKVQEMKELLQQLTEQKQKLQYQLEQFKFTSEGKILDLQRRLQQSKANSP